MLGPTKPPSPFPGFLAFNDLGPERKKLKTHFMNAQQCYQFIVRHTEYKDINLLDYSFNPLSGEGSIWYAGLKRVTTFERTETFI